MIIMSELLTFYKLRLSTEQVAYSDFLLFAIEDYSNCCNSAMSRWSYYSTVIISKDKL